MAVTVGHLLAVDRLHLSTRTGRLGLDRPIRWAAVSELTDPAPFLEGGELLLSTGLQLDADDASALRAYVDRLVDAGVAAFGLGIALTHPRTPPALVQHATERDLPVLEVPHATPFIAVTRTLADLLSAQAREEDAHVLALHRRLVDAALDERPSHAVLEVLAAGLGGWAALIDENGGVAAVAGPARPEQLEVAAADVRRLAGRGPRSSAASDVAGEHVVVQPVGAGSHVYGFLAAASRHAPSSLRATLVAGAVSVLSLQPDQARRAAEALRLSHAVVVRLLLAGHRADAEEVAGAADLVLPPAPVRLLVADAGSAAADSLAAAIQAAAPAAVLAVDGSRLTAIVPADQADGSLADAVQRVPGASAGVSRATSYEALPTAAESAGQALRAAATGRGRVLFAEALGAADLLGLLQPAALAEHAAAVLGPLSAYGRNRDELLDSLRAWLQRGGHWDEAAADLGLHRNTLRYRIRRVEELTGRDLSSMHDRVELWLALQAHP